MQPYNPLAQDLVARQMAMDAMATAQSATSAAQSAATSAGSRLTACRMASASTLALITAAKPADVTVNWLTPMPVDVYPVEPVPGVGIIGAATLAVKSTTKAGCVITVTANAGVTVAIGAIVTAHAYC